MAETPQAPKIIRPQPGGQELFCSTNVDVCIYGGSLAGGKAQPLDRKVCTPFGFRRIGDLKVGDIISRVNGSFQKVIQIHERGVLDVVKIKFQDGRETLCAKDHLWKVRRTHNRNKRFRKSNDYEDMWELMTTEQLMNFLDNPKHKSIYIPNCGDVAFTKSYRARIGIDPYLLGALLGDGCLASYLDGARITSADNEIIERITPLVRNITRSESRPVDYTIWDGGLKSALKKAGLWGCLSNSKFIPQEYLLGKIDDRIALLQGLFDTDGSIDDRGHIEYDSVSEQLAKDVAFLVRSFGGKCTMTTKQGSYKDGDGKKIVCQKVYRLYIRLRDAARFFHLSRKKERANEYIHIGDDNFETAIVGYELLGKEEMRCITVSSPDALYLTDDFIVTHNSWGLTALHAEPSLDPNYRAVVLRRTLTELKTSGGMVELFSQVYGSNVSITKSDNPRITFASGASVECRQVADENPNKVREVFKGLQADCICFDELTGFDFYTWNYIQSRCRGTAKWTGKIRATTNPSKRHFTRKMLEWYIGPDGFVIPERSGVVRYFYLDGDTVEDYVWGDDKLEVYRKCKKSIDKSLRKLGHDASYENLIKSFTFILGSVSENKALLATNPDYIGSISGREGAALLEGSWDYDPDSETEAPIIASKARAIAENDPCMNGDRWITADLADVGTDNTIILAWNGFHVIDLAIIPKSTPKMNANAIKRMQLKHGVGDSHVIYDGQRATYMGDYIPEAVPYISSYRPRGLYRLNFQLLKDECYMRFVNAVNEGRISMDEEVAKMNYTHQKIKTPISVLTEFVDECSVVRFNEMAGGKKRLWTKKEMNSNLGHDGSMDLTDACSMRFFPCLACEYGQELEYGVMTAEEEEEIYGQTVNVYDDSTWC